MKDIKRLRRVQEGYRQSSLAIIWKWVQDKCHVMDKHLEKHRNNPYRQLLYLKQIYGELRSLHIMYDKDPEKSASLDALELLEDNIMSGKLGWRLSFTQFRTYAFRRNSTVYV